MVAASMWIDPIPSSRFCSAADLLCSIFFFFFQAEDGIRDLTVTGVQTCALPISSWPRPPGPDHRALTTGNDFANSIVETKALACGETARTSCQRLIVHRRLDVRRAMPVQTRGWNGLRENDADRNKNRSRARSKRHGHFDARAFWILIPAAEADSAFRQVLANHYFFGKAAPPDARQHARLHACAIAPWNHALLGRAARPVAFAPRTLRERLNPNRRRVAMAAVARHALANFK